MRPVRVTAVLISRIGRQSLPISSGFIQCKCFHTGTVFRLPNPYSKRPSEFPEPVDKLPDPQPTHPEHGLYGFFRNKKSVTPAARQDSHGIIVSEL